MKIFLILLIFMFYCTTSFAADYVPPKGAILSSIDWNSPEMRKRYSGYFEDIMGQQYDNLTLKIKIDQISKELFNSGFFNSVIKPEISGVDKKVHVKISVEVKERINFDFKGNSIFSHQELRSKIIDKAKNEFGKAEISNLASFIVEQYELAGFYGASVSTYENSGVDLAKIKFKNLFFIINEGKKIKVREILYRGNSNFNQNDLNNLLKKRSTPLVSSGFYDKQFFEEFSEILKKEYLSKGFVFAEVSKPRLVTNEEDGSFTVEYGISEKQQVILREVNFLKVPQELRERAKASIVNKEGSPINVVELENDLRKMVVFFQNEGYYFTTIANINSDNLLVYDKSYATAVLSPEIILDRQICFNETFVNGNIKTNVEVINREINLEKGELITPDKLELIRQKLSALNLFSSLRLTPYMVYESEVTGCPKTNLVIQVKEKDFGLLEIAPGYRTDLGAKLSTGLSYNNLMGMNRSASLRTQLNQRFNLDGFDDKRRMEDKKLLEYSIKASFVEPYVFHNILKSQLEFELSSSFQRSRFYGFDADVFRLSPQFSKTFNRYLSTSVRYQFERIIQFDATEDKDNDNFSIGGITPSITLDFRDDSINTRKGALFTLSSEWANSNFGSMKEKELEVNFVKVISRNKFYYPVGDFTLALSLAMGYQKNFATEILKDASGNTLLNSNGQPKTRGYIPSIKVFRLDGYDEIRGYDEGEINRLMNGTPIGEVVVQDEAYFTALKFEPRYNLTDALQLGVFFDAGRVFVREYDPLDLRTSVGAGVKFLTPVGSLDFDYGFKLQRKNPEGRRDSVGRFHLSIGFF